VTEARMTTVAGGMLAAVLAIWCAGEFYRLHVADFPSYFPKQLDVWWVGIPLALSYGVALFLVTRRDGWLPSRWARRSLGAFLVRSIFVGAMIYVPLQFVAVLPLALAPMPHYQPTPGISSTLMLMLAFLVLAILVAGQAMVLAVARLVASGIAREEQRLFGRKDSDEQR